MIRSRKKLITVLTLVLAAGVVFLLWRAMGLRMSGGRLGSATPQPTLPSASGENTVSLQTTGGESIRVRDFFAHPADQSPSEVVLQRVPAYEAVYFKTDNAFLIILKTKPLSEARRAAEAAFLDALGISRTDACRLRVILNVSFDADEKLFRNDYSLSFCPGSTLPF